MQRANNHVLTHGVGHEQMPAWLWAGKLPSRLPIRAIIWRPCYDVRGHHARCRAARARQLKKQAEAATHAPSVQKDRPPSSLSGQHLCPTASVCKQQARHVLPSATPSAARLLASAGSGSIACTGEFEEDFTPDAPSSHAVAEGEDRGLVALAKSPHKPPAPSKPSPAKRQRRAEDPEVARAELAELGARAHVCVR